MKVAMGVTPKNITEGLNDNARLTLRNVGTTTVYLGHTPAEATSLEGYPLNAGDAFEFSEPLRAFAGVGSKNIFASVASGTGELRILVV